MKFAVGEIAIFIKAEMAFDRVGQQVTIKEIGPFKAGLFHIGYSKTLPAHADYIVECQDGFPLAVDEYQLRKLPGDYIPTSILALFTKKHPNPDKVKEKERG